MLCRRIFFPHTHTKDGKKQDIHHLPSVEAMVGRFVAGIGVGYAMMIALVYSGGISPRSIRGLITSFTEAFINLGELLEHVSNYSFPKPAANLGLRVVRTDHDGDPAGIDMDYRQCGLPIIPYADLVVLKLLGSGRYGIVYHGKWMGTDVAIKIFDKSRVAKDYLDRLTKTFWREAQILSKLHHPQVVAFYGVVLDGPEGTLAYVTEYMVDGSLRCALLEKGELDRRTKLTVLLNVASGMEYLHSMDVVHFDLKSPNLLVNLRDPQRPVCKVADLGLSKIKQNALVSGRKRGPLGWMAPELLNGRRNKVSDKVDVYAYGITTWETETRKVPYGDMDPDIIRSGVAYSNLRPAIPEYCDPELRKLMEECWSPDPAARPSFTQIRERLQAMLMALQLDIQN